MATSIMNTLGGKMIISEDKLDTVCRTGQNQYVGGVPKYRDASQNLGT